LNLINTSKAKATAKMEMGFVLASVLMKILFLTTN